MIGNRVEDSCFITNMHFNGGFIYFFGTCRSNMHNANSFYVLIGTAQSLNIIEVFPNNVYNNKFILYNKWAMLRAVFNCVASHCTAFNAFWNNTSSKNRIRFRNWIECCISIHPNYIIHTIMCILCIVKIST